MADENPSGLGAFDLPLRLPGQYFDKETNLHYNYYRDYDPSIGRYGESDPIGLGGGINTYAYVTAKPLAEVDPLGLQGVATIPEAGVVIGLGCFLTPGCREALQNLAKRTIEACKAKDDSADCERASTYLLRAAGITDEHAFKADYVGRKGVSRYDICACKDGSIKIAQVGQCGTSGPKIDTHARWK